MKIRYVSWVGTSGYAVAAQGYLLALIEARHTVSWTPLFSRPTGISGWFAAPTPDQARDGVRRYCDDMSDPGAYNGQAALDAIDRLADDAAEIAVLHCVPEAWADQRGNEAATVGNTVWETDQLPGHWPALLNQMDSVVVPCTFNREVMIDCGVTAPVHVVPHVAPHFGRPVSDEETAELTRDFDIPHAGTLFFCCDQWDARKAPYKTIAAFLAAFNGNDDVTLVLKTGPYGTRSGADPSMHRTPEQVAQLLSTHSNPPRVTMITADLPRRAIQALHEMSDCYVSLTHGEGWGLGVYESVATGTPVITTGWGGTLDYLGGQWPYLVDYELVPTMNAAGMPSYDPAQRWAAADLDHAVRLMHEVVNRPGQARDAAAVVRTRIYEENNPARVADRLAGAMSP